MTTKIFTMYLAKAPFETAKHFDEIKEACEYAAWGLFRSKIRLHDPTPTQEGGVSVVLDFHDETKTTNIGYRLRGISKYLLKKYPSYREFMVGERLMYFYEKEETDE